MATAQIIPHLTDMIEACARISGVLEDLSIEAFEADWQKRWLVERGLEIVSEASRRLPEAAKARHPEIPWPKVAGIGNILRHEYQRVAADVLWKLGRYDLPVLKRVCEEELALSRGE